MLIPKKSLLALLPFFLQGNSQTAGVSTRYWDCCKPSCAWTKKISLASGATPVVSCDKNDNPLTDFDAKSGCDGGGAYSCTNQTPWAASDSLAYGFAAVSISGGTEASWCCACYELTFTSGPVSGKKMIVQATNTGGDLGANHFDIAMPGGGFGIFNGCTAEFGTPSTGWGAQYGGISSRSQCDAFPVKLKPACYWRFDWFLNADNPALTFKQITCPLVLTSKTGCVRAGEVPTGGGTATSSTKAVTSSTKTTTAPAQVSTTTKSTTKASTTVATTTSSQASTGGTSPHWGQCGGIGWTGPTKCVSPYTCVATGPYYSQCV